MAVDDDDDLLADVRRVIPVVRATLDDRSPERVPGFRILRRLGAGGMGIVYEAEQQSPRRTVALKVIRPDCSSPAALRRFEYEAEVLARLQHPGIAQIHAAGAFAGPDGPQPFFAMELVSGLPLMVHARERALSRRDRLQLFAKVCDAVQHAHEKGVIHRDLKPSNILVDGAGLPKILDFGVARLADGAAVGPSMHTLAGQIIGTVPYMSPEQVRADPADIDVRSDVYTLGTVGFELLTGRLPHDLAGVPVTEAVRIIAEAEPALLGDSDPALRGDLEIVFGKALARERERRYASAAELARDVERFLANEPIAARPPTATYQLRKLVARHRALVGAAAAVLLCLVLGAAVAIWQLLRALDAERLAGERRNDAEFEARISAAIVDNLRMILDESGPSSEAGRPVTVLDAIEHAETKLDKIDEPLVQAHVRDLIGSTYASLHRFDAARVHLETALALVRRHRRAPHAEIGHALNQLARLHGIEEDHAAAAALYRAALQCYAAVHGPEHEMVARSCSNLATTLHKQARATGDPALFAEAQQLLDRAVAVARRTGGRPHFVASFLAARGSLQRDMADGAGAEQSLREALAIWASTPYGNDPIAAIARSNLGLVLHARGALAEAEPLFREALTIFRGRYGDEHEYTKRARANVAAIERRLNAGK